MSQTDDLTVKQRRVLDCIREFIQDKGYPPTVREIGEIVGLSSSSSVHAHLRRLERAGYIKKGADLNRTLTLIHKDEFPEQPSILQLPILGRVAAGYPILAVENIEDTYPVPADMLPGEDGFMLRVRGTSMIEDGILDGDLVVVRKQEAADNGDTIVALVEDEATVKRFYKEEKQIRLQPANSSMEPMYFDTVRIIGKVVGLMRKMS